MIYYVIPRELAQKYYNEFKKRFADELLEGAALHVLEHQIVVVLAGATVYEGHQVGVVEESKSAALPVEASPGARILIERGLQALDRYEPLLARVPRLVDDAHATTAEHSAQLIAVLEERSRSAFVAGNSHALVRKPWVLDTWVR